MTRSTASTLLLLFCCFGLLTMSGIAQTPSTKEAPEDAELYMDNYSLYVNRQLVVQNAGLGGKVLWFCLPEQGQFIISTNPHKGYDFKKVGAITGTMIAFWHNGSYYEWISSSPIVRDGTERELWLLTPAEPLTKGCAGGTLLGAASPFEALISEQKEGL